MDSRLETMRNIQAQKEKEIAREPLRSLDAEGEALAEHKRFTFDVIDIPSDPLR